MIWLLDTSVYSQLLRRNAVVPALERWTAAGDPACAISEVTRAEVEYGLHREANPARWRRYRETLEHRLAVLDTDAEVWSGFALMKARQRKLGEPVGDFDLLIAATAVRRGLIVATLDTGDFSRIEGLTWEDWSR